MNLLDFGKTQIPSIIKNPFNKVSIKSINIYYREDIFSRDGKWSCTANVEFKNGNTEGKQKFEHEDFNTVVLQIKAFIATLK